MNISFELFLPKITLFYRILSPNSHFYRIWKQKIHAYNSKYEI